MLQLATQHSHEVITIWCKGRIVLGGDLHRLRVATLSQSTPEVMLDLSSVNLIDAAGLGALVDLHKRFQCAGKKMGLMDPTRFVSQVFRIARLDTVFHIVRTRQNAVGPASRRKPWSVFVQLCITTLVAVGVVVPRSGSLLGGSETRKGLVLVGNPSQQVSSTSLTTRQSGAISGEGYCRTFVALTRAL